MTASRKPPEPEREEGRNGYVKVPRAVLFRTSLSAEARIVYAKLLEHARGGAECWPRQDVLAAELAMSRRSLERRIAELVSAGLVEWERKGRGHPSVYRLAVTVPDLFDPPTVAGQTKPRETLDPPTVADQTKPREALDPPTVAAERRRSTSLRLEDSRSSPPPRRCRSSLTLPLRDGEEEMARASRDTATDELQRLGMDPQTARDVASQYDEATIAEACRRLRERRPPPRHVVGWLKRTLKSVHVANTECAQPTAEERQAQRTAARLAEQKRMDRERAAELRRTWERLSAAKRRSLIAEARRRMPALQGRPDDHRLVVAAAINVLGE
jgi:hypothetical protein